MSEEAIWSEGRWVYAESEDPVYKSKKSRTLGECVICWYRRVDKLTLEELNLKVQRIKKMDADGVDVCE